MPAHETDLQLLARAAEEGGRIAMRYWRKDPRAWDKGGAAGPVSEADLAVNAYLEDTLRGARGDYGWLSEESPDSPTRLGPGRLFVVDPIDGTRAFLDGQQGFAQSIAIVEGGRAVAGAVHLPALGLTYLAQADGPATLNGQPIRAREHDFDGATALASKPTLAPDHWRTGCDGLRRQFRTSLAWRLCLVAEGRFNAALSWRSTWEWDVAAGSLIAERAGAQATDRMGQAMRFNAAQPRLDGLIVAPPRLHGQIMARLAGQPQSQPGQTTETQ